MTRYIQPTGALEHIERLIYDVADFPRPGIVFKDITPLLAEPAAFAATLHWMADAAKGAAADGVLAIESRGFIFGTAVAHSLGLPLHLVRKRGKLPRPVISQSYDLEYGADHVEVHADALSAGARYLLVDDVIATGGTAAAVHGLVEKQGASLAAALFLMELTALDGRRTLSPCPVHALLRY